MRRVLACDPGVTTGVAFGVWISARKEWDGQIEINQFKMDTCDADHEFDMARAVMMTAVKCKAEILVMEDFYLRLPAGGSARSGLSPVRVGMAAFSIWRSMEFAFPVSFVWQQPGEMAIATDERLKSKGMWIPGMPHAMDACRHLEIWRRKHG